MALEEAGRGPASWDLVPHLVGVRRYGASEDVCRSFLDAYGADPVKWEGIEILCRAYELLMIVWAIAHRHASPAMAAEGELRLSSFLDSTDETGHASLASPKPLGLPGGKVVATCLHLANQRRQQRL